MKEIKATCGIFLIDRNAKTLICHATNKDDTNWSIPKGIKDENETAEEAAIRELKEETSIDLSKIKHTIIPIGEIEYTHKAKKLIGFVVNIDASLDELLKNGKIKCNSYYTDKNIQFPEIDRYEVLLRGKALERMHYTQKELFTKFLDNNIQL
jgi:8-oxo-dGTP pyrophosphatase MutT (NUDIX family)